MPEPTEVAPSTEEVVETPKVETMEVPSEQPEDPETPAEEVETTKEPEVEEEVELFELPDGRKVDGVTLAKEWKENFMPDYTKKSQTIANIEKGILPDNQPAKKLYEDPNWQPQSYAEIIELAKKDVMGDLEAREQERVAQEQAIEGEVVKQLSELKTLDKTLNENALFLHANKYGFKDLKVAYQNMKDMSKLAKNVQSETVKNIAKRKDPVSVSPGATGQQPDPSQFESAAEYLRSLK